MRLVVLILALGAGHGCAREVAATPVRPASLDAAGGWIAVPTVPHLGSSGGDGGPAALAMVLTYWKQAIAVADVASACRATTNTGNTRADDLRAFAADRGFAAFVVAGDLETVEHELAEGRPVVVGLVERRGLIGYRGRYALVVGYHPARRRVVTLDAERGWQEVSVEAFVDAWNPSERLLLVIIPPG
jgi:ABC-type bacteriocin/lantibiotic exporter with double-glycine peptidase domain